MTQPLVLVVEDEPSFVEALQVGLSREGFDVAVATDGIEALVRFREVNPDVVLLDVMLPRASGIDVCRQIRAISAVPIIMVTAKSSELDTVVGLEVGADDYVSKPYRIRELVARIRAQLRRIERDTPSTPSSSSPSSSLAHAGSNQDDTEPVALVPGSVIAVGSVSLDPAAHRVVVDGVDVVLPRKEFEVLHLLLANAGRVLTRETLINRVWGYDYVGDTKTLDVHIKRIRSKVEVDPTKPERIVTIRGLGYKYATNTNA